MSGKSPTHYRLLQAYEVLQVAGVDVELTTEPNTVEVEHRNTTAVRLSKHNTMNLSETPPVARIEAGLDWTQT